MMLIFFCWNLNLLPPHRAMELALAVPVGTALPDIKAQIVAASAADGEGAPNCIDADPPVADEEGWVTAASLRAQRAARRGGVGVSGDAATSAAAPTQSEIFCSTDTSTGLAAVLEQACPLDPAAAAVAAVELLDMGFDIDRAKVLERGT